MTVTVTDRMGCIPILAVNVTFMMESLGVNEPLISQIKLMALVDGEEEGKIGQ